MMKPKIIVCATAYRPMVGGAEIAVEEIARRLAGDFDFFILTARMSRASPAREVGSDGTIMRLGWGMPLDKWLLPVLAVWHARKIIGARDSALVWGMDISHGSLAALCIGWHFRRVPLVVTAQYGEGAERLQSGRGGWIRRAFRVMLLRADRVTAISSYLRDMARAHGYCGSCVVIPNGADGEKFRNKKSKSNPARTGHEVMTISRLVPKNGVDILIRAIAVVKKEIPDIRCRIAGDGADRARLEAMARQLGITDAVDFLGTVPHAELAGYLHDADVFARLSRSEGMGNVFVEAIAAGVPVVATAVGGIPDIIDDGITGLFAKPDDPFDAAEKIIRVLRDPDFGAALAARARENTMRRFDWSVIAEQYRRVFYEELHGERRITIAAGIFPPDIGGPATYAALLTDTLAAERIGVRVCYFGGVRRLPRLIRHAVYFLQLLFTARGSDIIFAQDPVSVGLPALAAARIIGARFAVKIVGDYAWEQYQVKSQKSKDKSFETLEDFQQTRHDWLTEMRRCVQHYVARRADLIIVPSGYLRGIVVGWGAREEKIAMVYNAVATPERAALNKEDARKKLGLSGMVIIAAGRLVPWKGLAMLIDAVADLAGELPELSLVIAGSGPEEENLRRKIGERRVGGRARMIGAIPHDVLMQYFFAGDIFVLNSGYEGLSHTLIEAMSAGLPTIATRVGGNPEVITDGTEGLLIAYGNSEELKNALRSLAGDNAARALMGAAGRTRAAAFTQEKMIKETAAVLKSLS